MPGFCNDLTFFKRITAFNFHARDMGVNRVIVVTMVDDQSQTIAIDPVGKRNLTIKYALNWSSGRCRVLQPL